jgi:uroporphyrinogen-III synthase
MPDEKKPDLRGLHVLSLESRRAEEMRRLIENYNGKPVVAPAMREVPLESNTEAIAFARALAAGEFDFVIFLTGVGTRFLARVVETIYPVEKFAEELRRTVVIARGPKPVAALKEMGVPVTLSVPEPNTWRDLLRVLDENVQSLPIVGKQVALQEYGKPNTELVSELEKRGARVTSVPVYQWMLPEDTAPLRAAVESIARAEIDIALFTTSVQVTHLLEIARAMDLEQQMRLGFAAIEVGSIGPVTSEALREQGLHVDFEPAHPKMGILVNEAARRTTDMLGLKGKQKPT